MVNIRNLIAEVGKLHERAISLGAVKPDTSDSDVEALIHKDWSLALTDEGELGEFFEPLTRGAIRLLDLAYVFNVDDIVHKEFEAVITSDVYDEFAIYSVPALINALHLQTCALFDIDYMRFKVDLSDVAHTIGDTLGLLYKWMNDVYENDNYEYANDFETAITEYIQYIRELLDDIDVMWWEEKERDTNDHT